MGSSSKTYKQIQVIPVMEDYNDLDRTLFNYDAQNISNGMPAVMAARKHTMLTMRSTLNERLMSRLGFEADSTATYQVIDDDLLLFDLQEELGDSVDKIVDSRIGLPTVEEMGHVVLQSVYPDYTVDGREFTHTDGVVYRYSLGVEVGGGHVEASCYRKPTVADLVSDLGGQYDTIDIIQYNDYPIETSDGVFETEVTFNYIEYSVKITTKTGDSTSVTEYTTTVIGDVVTGTVVDGDTTITTRVVTTIVGGVESLPIVRLYIQGTNTSYSLLEDMNTLGGTYTNQQQWCYTKTIENYFRADDEVSDHIGKPPKVPVTTETTYSAYLVDYTVEISIVIITLVEFDVTAVVTVDDSACANFTPDLESMVRARVLSDLKDIYEADYKSIIVKYSMGSSTYLKVLHHMSAVDYFIDKEQSLMPIIPLKDGKYLDTTAEEERNKKIALRDMGMVGDEFNKSLEDKTVRYASLGFMFDVNEGSETTTKLVYHTLEHLSSHPDKVDKDGDVVGPLETKQGFTLHMDNLEISLLASYDMSVHVGRIGNVGTYTYTEEPYTTTHVEEDPNFGPTTVIDHHIRRYYKHQVNKYQFKVIALHALDVRHSYRSVSTMGVFSKSTQVDRLPIMREVLRHLNFKEYVYTVQMAMTLVIYTKVTVKTKWYQSGIFKFVMAVIAVVLAFFTGGQSLVVYAGAIAGAVLAVANLIGIDLGVVGTILQVIAIVGAVVGVYNNITAGISAAQADTSVALANNAKTVGEAALSAKAVGDMATYSSLMDAANWLSETSGAYGAAAGGSIGGAVGATGSAINDSSNIIKRASDTIKGFRVTPPPVPVNDMGFLEIVQYSGIKDVVSVVKTLKGMHDFVNGLFIENELTKMKSELSTLNGELDTANEELKVLEESKGAALRLAPHEIESYADKLCSTSDVMSGMTDMHATLTSSVDTDAEYLMWKI